MSNRLYIAHANLLKVSERMSKQFNSEIIIGEGALDKLPELLIGDKINNVFVIADKSTYLAAGEKVVSLLTKNGIETKKYVFSADNLEPDESAIGLAITNFDTACDAVIGVGSGVINDICKIVATVSKKKYVIVATAPSMDGYASSTSSVTREGLKISLNCKCADIIIGDTDILSNAPIKMMISGVGDMLAKYISICEWRISNLINGEYYNEEIAGIVRNSLKKCIDKADGLLSRNKKSVEAVFEGLLVCGAAMKLAGVSRPASGIEHYLSHIWDMRNAEFKTPTELHGIQCALGTFIALNLYEEIKRITPDRRKALDYVRKFDLSAWNEELRNFLGKGAASMIAIEEKEQKYDPKKHSLRLERIIEKWDEIKDIITQELPCVKEIEALFDKLGLPKKMSDVGLDKSILPMTFKAAKDIRDKYVLPRLCWDLGILDDMILFKTETHLHTAEVSRCSHLSGAEMIRLYSKKGYDTVFVSDHFSRAYFESLGDITWSEKTERFMSGYKAAKEEGNKLGVNVIFSAELTVDKTPTGTHNHYLLYGIDKEFLDKNENLFDLTIEEIYSLAKENGVLVIQSHPLRDGKYIPTPKYVDGFEAVNTNPRHENFDDEVFAIAEKYGLRVSSGSDSHRVEDVVGGVLTNFEIKTSEDFISAFKNGDLTLIKRGL